MPSVSIQSVFSAQKLLNISQSADLWACLPFQMERRRPRQARAKLSRRGLVRKSGQSLEIISNGANYALDGLQCLRKRGHAEHRQ